MGVVRIRLLATSFYHTVAVSEDERLFEWGRNPQEIKMKMFLMRRLRKPADNEENRVREGEIRKVRIEVKKGKINELREEQKNRKKIINEFPIDNKLLNSVEVSEIKNGKQKDEMREKGLAQPFLEQKSALM